MANRYWVGGSGSWGYTTHWSESSGGVGGASIPTKDDDAVFDENSTGTVAINTSGCRCASLYCDNSAAVTFTDTSYTLEVYRHVYFNENITCQLDNIAMFCTLSSVLSTADVDMSTVVLTIQGDGLAYGVTLENDISLSHLIVNRGFFDTGGHNISTGGISMGSVLVGKKCILRSSTITIGNQGISLASINNASIDAGTSRIVLTYNGTIFNSGGHTFNDLESQVASITIKGNNTFLNIIGIPDGFILFEVGSNNTINDLSADGTSGHLISIKSVTNGSPYTLTKASGSISVRYYSIRDCIATGGATFNAINSTDATGNTGWVFYPLWATPIYNRTKSYLKFYNIEDINRVANNSMYLAGYAEDKGISPITLDAWVEDVTRTDLPTYALINLLEHNINTLLAGITGGSEPGFWVTLNEDWSSSNDVFRYYNANNLEWNQSILKYLLDAI